MAVFLFSLGDDVHKGTVGEYNQVDYDAPLSEFAIYRNNDGSVTVSHPTIGTDTLLNIDGLWSDADQSWYSIEDAIAVTSDAPSSTPAPTPTPAPSDGFTGTILFTVGDDTHVGSADEYSQIDYDASISEFTIYRNNDGSVTVSHPTIGTDTLINVDGIWSHADQSWYSIEDAIAVTSDAPSSTPAPTPTPAPSDDGFTGTILFTVGDDTHIGSAHEYSQIDYDASISEFAIYRNNDGSVTVSHPVIGTDTLINVDGIWSHADQSWYSIEDAIAVTSDAPSSSPTPTPDTDFDIDDFGVLRGTDANDVLNDTDATNSLYGGLGNDTLNGTANEYSQAEYDGAASEYTFTQNANGSVTVTHATYGTDTLTNIDGLWFQGEKEWYAIEDLVDNNTAPNNPPQDEPADDNGTGVLVDGIITGSNDVNDTLIGDAGDNVFFAGRGTDVIEGGAGLDTLNVDGDIFEWTYSANADGSVTMTHPTWGENTLIGIEQITSMRSGLTFSIDDAIASTDGLPRFRLDSDNVINGTNGDDVISAADDVQGFYGGTGDDTFLGTDDGFEQINYDGARSEYTITQNDDGSITVDHPIWGTDTLVDIDAMIFTGVEPGVGGAVTAPFEFISTDDLFA